VKPPPSYGKDRPRLHQGGTKQTPRQVIGTAGSDNPQSSIGQHHRSQAPRPNQKGFESGRGDISTGNASKTGFRQQRKGKRHRISVCSPDVDIGTRDRSPTGSCGSRKPRPRRIIIKGIPIRVQTVSNELELATSAKSPPFQPVWAVMQVVDAHCYSYTGSSRIRPPQLRLQMLPDLGKIGPPGRRPDCSAIANKVRATVPKVESSAKAASIGP
jgi:hypothetical protein